MLGIKWNKSLHQSCLQGTYWLLHHTMHHPLRILQSLYWEMHLLRMFEQRQRWSQNCPDNATWTMLGMTTWNYHFVFIFVSIGGLVLSTFSGYVPLLSKRSIIWAAYPLLSELTKWLSFFMLVVWTGNKLTWRKWKAFKEYANITKMRISQWFLA